MPGTTMREVLLHGGHGRSVRPFRRLRASAGRVVRRSPARHLHARGSAGGRVDRRSQRRTAARGAPGDRGRSRGNACRAASPSRTRNASASSWCSASVPRTRRSSATPTNTPSTSPSSRPRRATRRRSHTRSSSRVDARCSCCGDSERPAARGLLERLVSDGGRVERSISWYSPDPRGVMPLDTFHVPSRLQRTLRRSSLQVRIDAAFSDVMRACAEAEREGEDGGTLDQRRDHRQLHARCTRSATRTRSRSATAIGWSAASTASRSAGRSSASRCSTPSPMRRRLRWSR